MHLNFSRVHSLSKQEVTAMPHNTVQSTYCTSPCYPSSPLVHLLYLIRAVSCRITYMLVKVVKCFVIFR